MRVTRFEKSFKLEGGRWIAGNMYDKLVNAAFDKFVNLHRKLPVVQPERLRRDLSMHNHVFNFTNR